MGRGFRILGVVLLGIVAQIPALAAPPVAPVGAVSGFVRNAAGLPQFGAAVEIMRSASHSLTVFTDERGYYLAAGIEPGRYLVRVTAPAFLPAQRESINFPAGVTTVVNFTLNTLFDAVNLLPSGRTPAQEDDWKWVLRSSGNRSVLRAVNGPNQPKEEPQYRGEVSLIAGGEGAGYGTSDLGSTTFSLERSLFTTGTLSFAGDVGYGALLPATSLRATYSQHLANGSDPSVALTVRRFAGPESAPGRAALQALSLRVADSFTVGDMLELKFGEELDAIQFVRRVNAIQPFGSAALHLSPNTILAYGFSTSVPNTRIEKGFDTAPADLSETAPRVTMQDGDLKLEKAQHQEISLSRKFGQTSVQVAAYHDALRDAALTGVGEPGGTSLDTLDDPYSSNFTFNAGRANLNGMRLVVQHRFGDYMVGTVDYGYGGVISASDGSSLPALRQSLHVGSRQSIAGKASGTAPGIRTKWIASYKWTDGRALTPTDLFNTSPGQTDPYLNVFLRQPVPYFSRHMELVLDLRNLLAEGYVPVVGQDRHTLYLVQSARAVRGGLSFTF